MAKKNIQIGNLIVTEDKTGRQRVSIGLGNKGSNPKYNLSVELVVKDAEGKVVARQTDGYLDLVDPRKQPDELLKAGKINEETALRMKENVSRLSDKIKYKVSVQGL